jgi:ribosomal protein L32
VVKIHGIQALSNKKDTEWSLGCYGKAFLSTAINDHHPVNFMLEILRISMDQDSLEDSSGWEAEPKMAQYKECKNCGNVEVYSAIWMCWRCNISCNICTFGLTYNHLVQCPKCKAGDNVGHLGNIMMSSHNDGS